MRATTVTTNFTAGEFSPRLRGRSDLDKFNASAELLRNVVILPQGGATLRPPLDFVDEIKVSAETARPIDFVFSRTDAYVLVFGHLTMQVIRNGAYVESSPGVRYEISTPYTQAQLADLDYTQGSDTMILTHGSVPTMRLRRFAHARWVLDAAPFSPAAMAEVGHRSDTVSMTISDPTVGTGRTLTASGSFFCDADVNRIMSWGGGVAIVTVVGSPTSATCSVTTAFASTAAAANEWLLEGTPLSACTPTAKDPIGGSVTLNLAVGGWRTIDVGKHVEINGGLVRLTSISGHNATGADGVIVNELASTVAAPSNAWVLKGNTWNAVDGYPETCTFYEQRLWLGCTSKFPQSKWGSRSGLPFNFTQGPEDDAAVYKTIASDQINPLQFLVSASSLLALGYGGEFESRGGIEKPITQQNMQIKLQTEYGSEAVRPETVGKEVLHVERGGKALRSLFPLQVEGYDSNDVSVFSEHLLASGVKFITFEQRPESVIWVGTNAGALHALTFNTEQKIVAWASGETDGVVEWGVTIPEGGQDATYCLVRRTIDGVTKRYIERLNWGAERGWHDSRVYQTSGSPKAIWDGLDHLEGKTVRAHADDVYVGTFVVDGGEIELPRDASTLSVGLPYDARIISQAPEVGTGQGTSQGQTMSTNAIKVRFLDTVGTTIQGEDIAFSTFGDSLLDQAPQLFTGIKDLMDYGWADGESPIELAQTQGYPWTVLAIVRTLTVNAG